MIQTGRCGCRLRTAKQFTNFRMSKPATSRKILVAWSNPLNKSTLASATNSKANVSDSELRRACEDAFDLSASVPDVCLATPDSSPESTLEKESDESKALQDFVLEHQSIDGVARPGLHKRHNTWASASTTSLRDVFPS